MNRSNLRWLKLAVLSVAGLVMMGGFALACCYVYLAPSLPTDGKQLPVPMQVYTRSGALISQIGEQRRIPVTYDEIPELVRKAVLAAEDDRFFEHSGLDWMGVVRALVTNVISVDATAQGGSTITQQAARNMFLTLEQTPRRKASEVFVTYRMERDLSKEEILAIYLNVATFGHRSYGIAAAAQTYYGKRLDELSLGQIATLVGVLPAPSRYNPISDPRAAEVRRNYVLGRMKKLGYVTAAEAAVAEKEPVATNNHAPLVDVEAEYVAEMARAELVKLKGESAVNEGYRVFTTIDGRLQAAANRAVHVGLMEYDRRHGYRGKLGKVQLPAGAGAAELDKLLQKFNSVAVLQVAVVTRVEGQAADVHIRGMGKASIDWEGMRWAHPANRSPSRAANVLAAGDVVHVVTDGKGNAELAQLPKAQTALVALDPDDGAVVALVGGFDFHLNKFNRVTQARRQPGSGFKPFLYSAALENGFTASSIIVDGPVVLDCQEEECWNPENSGGRSDGPMRFREALVQSKNQVSVKILRAIGVDTFIDHAAKFGFRKEALPPYLTLALGVQSTSPWDMATGYAVFANGGFKVEPYFISRIEDATGKVVFQAKPLIACAECEPPPEPPVAAMQENPFASPSGDETDAETEAASAADAFAAGGIEGGALPRPAPDPTIMAAAAAASVAPLSRVREVDAPPVLQDMARLQGGLGYFPASRLAPRVLSAQNAWIMDDIMHDAATRGTGARSNSLNRKDLAGKTGTTQSNRDNWFNGFNRNLVASVWVGADDDTSLGAREEGSRTALPIWIHFMAEALRNLPPARLERPAGLMDLRVSRTTGALADQQDPTAVYETFMIDRPPQTPAFGVMPAELGGMAPAEPLF